MRTFYVPFEDDIDDVSPVLARAMRELVANGRALPATGTPAAIEAAPVDTLADITNALTKRER